MNNFNEGAPTMNFMLMKRCLLFLGWGGFVGSLLGGVLYVLVPREYEAFAFLEASPRPIQNILESAGSKSDLVVLLKTVETIVGAPFVKSLVVDEINKMGSSEKVDFTARSIPGSRLIKLRVRAKSSGTATAAANAWAQTVVEAFNRQRVEDTTSSNMLLTEPFARTSREIDQFAVKIQDETARLEIRQVELKAIRSQVYSGIEELNGIDSKVQVIASSLPILRQKIKILPQILPAGSNSLQGAGKELAVPLFTEGTAPGKIIGIVSYGSNPLYLDLSKQINQQEVEQEMLLQRKTQLEALIKKGKLDIKNLGRECNDMTLKIANLQRQLSVRQKTYDVLSNSLSETELSGRFNVSNVRVFSLAGQAYPLSYFFAFVFGGIVLGAFIAFVVFYFQLSSAGTIAVEYRQTGRSV